MSGKHRSAFLRLLSLALPLLMAPVAANAINGAIRVIQCTDCSTSAQFKAAAVAEAEQSLILGTKVVMSVNHPRAALIDVTGIIRQRCLPGEGCEPYLAAGAGTAMTESGGPVTSDAQFEDIDQRAFGTRRNAPILPIDVPSEYGGSFINNPTLNEDTSSAISNVLYITRGMNPNSIPVGTVVTVVWSDGTKAKFVRVSAIGSLQWVYIEGSARNSNGDPIDQQGNLIGNPNTSGTGGGEAHNERQFSSGSFGFEFRGQSRCTTSTTIRVNGNRVSTWRGTVPCR